MKKITVLIFAAFLIFCGTLYASISNLTHMSCTINDNQFDFHFDRAVSYQINQKNDHFILIAFKNANLATIKKPNFNKASLIADMKIWQHLNQVYLKITYKKPVTINVETNQQEHFIVRALPCEMHPPSKPSTKKEPVKAEKPLKSNLKQKNKILSTVTENPVSSSVSSRPVISLSSKIDQQRKAIVVIDPGHGGKDPGASGPMATHEKNVVLAISRYLNTDLNGYATIGTTMTRDADYFITLRGRLAAARTHSADVFVAIHADSYLNDTAHGASVFALSLHGATNEAAHWLARRENEAVLAGAKFDDNSRVVQSVLLNLSQSATIADSLSLGKQVIQQLGLIAHLHTGFVEQAPFMVLKSPDIPSILVETGFISNADEETRLNSPDYQQALANAIATGVVNYLYKNPPQNSLIAAQQANQLNVTLSSNESLSEIARAYHTNVSALRTANHLNSDEGEEVVSGSRVHIPPG